MNEEHLFSIGMVARNHGASEIRLRQIHQAAEMASHMKCLPPATGDISVSMLKPLGVEANVTVATDLKTGWFVQLVDQTGKPTLLTIGRKFCIGGYDEVNRHTASKMLS